MKKHHKTITNAITKTVIGAAICTVGILLSLPSASMASSAKDKKQQTAAPTPTQKPSKAAPSTTAAPPSNKTLKTAPRIHKDLAVQDLIVTPNEFSMGERTIVVFDIRNLGQTRISEVSYVAYISMFNSPRWHTLFSGTLRNLSPGSTTGIKREVTIPQSLSVGRGMIKASIASPFSDDNTANNNAAKYVTIRQGPLPNLYISYARAINRHSAPLQAGSFFDIEFRVINNGRMESAPCKYKVKTEKPGGIFGWYPVEERSYDIYRLRPGEFMDASPTFQIPEDFPPGRNLRITIYVDSTNQINEISENDNKRTVKVHY